MTVDVVAIMVFHIFFFYNNILIIIYLIIYKYGHWVPRIQFIYMYEITKALSFFSEMSGKSWHKLFYKRYDNILI